MNKKIFFSLLAVAMTVSQLDSKGGFSSSSSSRSGGGGYSSSSSSSNRSSYSRSSSSGSYSSSRPSSSSHSSSSGSYSSSGSSSSKAQQSTTTQKTAEQKKTGDQSTKAPHDQKTNQEKKSPEATVTHQSSWLPAFLVGGLFATLWGHNKTPEHHTNLNQRNIQSDSAAQQSYPVEITPEMIKRCVEIQNNNYVFGTDENVEQAKKECVALLQRYQEQQQKNN